MAPSTQPRSLRYIAVQVHLWIGLVLAAYLLVLSVTGSLVVLRPQFHRWLAQPQIEVGAQWEGEAPERALNGVYPRILNVVEWLVRLHDNLLAGQTGRIINAAGGGLLAILAMTGLLAWATGRSRWRSVISTGRPAMSTVFARRLHIALGFWLCGLILVWALTAFYFGFPELFEGLFDLLDSNPDDDVRPGEGVLDALIKLHFGRFGGMFGRTVWIVLGLMPAVLVVTGVIMWVRRQRDALPRGGLRG